MGKKVDLRSSIQNFRPSAINPYLKEDVSEVNHNSTKLRNKFLFCSGLLYLRNSTLFAHNLYANRPSIIYEPSAILIYQELKSSKSRVLFYDILYI